MALSYAVITPAHNEEAHLLRLAESIASQTVKPKSWVVVDDGSSDRTPELARQLERQYDWVRVLRGSPEPGTAAGERGGGAIRSFSRGLGVIETSVDVVLNLDADVSFPPDYVERLLAAFASDPRLGIVSGSAHELNDGEWRQRFATGTSVWGAARAYRWHCLLDVLPFDERMGWDVVDEHKAQLRGWMTTTVLDLPFFHHRAEGAREDSRFAAWRAEGNVAYYLGYRPSYLLLRIAYRALREPAAVGLAAGYLAALVRRAPRCGDLGVRRRVREQQRLRTLGRRAREALGGGNRTGGA